MPHVGFVGGEQLAVDVDGQGAVGVDSELGGADQVHVALAEMGGGGELGQELQHAQLGHLVDIDDVDAAVVHFGAGRGDEAAAFARAVADGQHHDGLVELAAVVGHLHVRRVEVHGDGLQGGGQVHQKAVH